MPIGTPEPAALRAAAGRGRRTSRRASASAAPARRVQQPRLADRELDQREHAARARRAGSRPTGCGRPPTRSGSTGRRTRGPRAPAQRARRRPHSSQCAGASGESFLMRSTSTAERLRWQPPHEPPTSRAMAMPPERFRSSSYSARSSASTVRRQRVALAAHPLELAVDRHLLLGDLGAERAAPLVEGGPRRREGGQLRVEGLDLLHDLELLVLELGDPPLQRRDLVLQRLELAGVADRAAVEGLVVVVRPFVERWRSRPRAAAGRGRGRGGSSSTSAALGLEPASSRHDRVELGAARQVRPPVDAADRSAVSCSWTARRSSQRVMARHPRTSPGAAETRISRVPPSPPSVAPAARRWWSSSVGQRGGGGRGGGLTGRDRGRARSTWSRGVDGGRPPPPPPGVVVAVHRQVARAAVRRARAPRTRAPRGPRATPACTGPRSRPGTSRR